ncbi:DUF1822 family protein [Tolypothrix sp. FACHB-123]|uniref:DUF1822 family protein n=1 Tax=Tolypothrix sp. FACHB-123 TaxID=2692868 RepID=UPI0016839126|nr:DUF1822 family protein [Tolypothrix sp. FACHB-123]MBD2355401.1 DUF1822 family protein [Tolypothrix sp. FACHB-123]
MLKLRKLSTIYPNQLWLNLSQELQQEAWQQSQLHGNAAARCQAYLNYLCLKSFVPWLEAWLQEANQTPGKISHITWDSLWEFVNGTPIELAGMRLLLVPSETSDLEEFAIPCEWVDIPSWRKDYYLAVQINLGDSEQSWLRVWGYASYEKLKQQGIYDESDRTYYISQEVLAEDFSQALFLPQPETIPQGEAPPQLSAKVAQELLEQLSKPDIYSPRLAVPFAQWSALLTNEQWRQQLYNQRLGLTATVPAVNLRQWLQKADGIVAQMWQAVETLLTPRELSAVRGAENPDVTVSSEAIAPLIRLLQSDRPEKERCQAAGVLGQIGIGHPEAIEALTQLLRTANDEETRWEAALSLGKIAPEHPQAGVSKARLIDLGIQLGTYQVALVVTIRPKTEEKIGVRLQVQPINQQHKLPPNLQLSVISGGETRLQAESRSDEQGEGKDKLLQLGFSPPPGTQFQVRVSLEGVCVSEDFIA